MNENIMQEIVHELFSSLEALETQSAAILQFLKDKGVVDKQELAPYLEQAGNASSVRWRAARVRIDYLISSAKEAAEREATNEPPSPKEDGQGSSKTGAQMSSSRKGEKYAQDTPQGASSPKLERADEGISAQRSQDQSSKENQNEGSTGNRREKAA
jgi:hypothetical protein